MRDLRDTAKSRETGVNSRWREENDGEDWGGLCPGATSCNRRCGAGRGGTLLPLPPHRHATTARPGARGVPGESSTKKITPKPPYFIAAVKSALHYSAAKSHTQSMITSARRELR